jgi:VIT1/CCC1 family predicted Fe2+/Mn2+ transporter
MSPRLLSASYFRNFVFGVEDSLVSTVGLLSGVALAGVAQETIIISGIVLIFVEAFSMGAGSFLSERSAQEYATRTEVSPRQAGVGALIMFVSYALSGFVPLLPYLFFPAHAALGISVALALAALAMLGAISAKLSGTTMGRSIRSMLVIGGAAILVGVIAGQASAALGIAV